MTHLLPCPLTGGAAHGQFTTLQREVNRFVIIIAISALVTGVIVILTWAFWLRVKHPSFLNVSSMLANTIAVIVAFVPEGLPLALAVGLNIIARRLCGAYFVLVKRLGTIETVGSMSLLASDKTGDPLGYTKYITSHCHVNQPFL